MKASRKTRRRAWMPGNGRQPPGPAPFTRITYAKKRRYLDKLVETGCNVTLAARLAGISRFTPYSRPWREDAEFQAALQLAREMAADALEGELYRRAYEGTLKPVGFYKGEATTWIREYSDVLGIFLLKSLKPEKYKERIEMKGLLAGIDVERLLDKLPHEAIDRLANGEHLLAVLASLAQRGAARLGLALPLARPSATPLVRIPNRTDCPPGIGATGTPGSVRLRPLESDDFPNLSNNLRGAWGGESTCGE